MDFLHISEILSRIGEIQQRFQFDFGMPATPFENVLSNTLAQNAQKNAMVPPSPQSVEIQSALKDALSPIMKGNALLPLEAKEQALKSLMPLTQSAAPSNAANAVNPAGLNLEDLIASIAQSNNLEPSLVKAIVSAESNFNPKAVSSKGAIGLMQLMPDTARGLGVINPFNPEDNLTGGVAYLKQLLSQFGGDVPLALAAYNAGPGAVKQHGGIPPYGETQNFVNKVLSLKKQYEEK